MEYQPSGQVSCGFKGSAGYGELRAGPAVNDGQWHTVRCVKTSSSIQVVVDGQTFSKAATIGSIANTASVVDRRSSRLRVLQGRAGPREHPNRLAP